MKILLYLTIPKIFSILIQQHETIPRTAMTNITHLPQELLALLLIISAPIRTSRHSHYAPRPKQRLHPHSERIIGSMISIYVHSYCFLEIRIGRIGADLTQLLKKLEYSAKSAPRFALYPAPWKDRPYSCCQPLA